VRSGAEPQPKSNLVPFSHKIGPPVAAIVVKTVNSKRTCFCYYADSVDLFGTGTLLAVGSVFVPVQTPLAYGSAVHPIRHQRLALAIQVPSTLNLMLYSV